MNLAAGLIGRSPGWEELLQQIGVPVVHPVPRDLPAGSFSAVIVTRPLSADEMAFVREYLRGGGALLGPSVYLDGLLEQSDEPVRLNYIIPEPGGRIQGVSLLDVESRGVIPREANCLRTNENVYAVFAGELSGGMAVVTPFDPGEMMGDFRATERYFYARPERLPSERVSRVAKGELMHFVTMALEYLHHSRGIPFARLSPFPAGASNVAAFRIDTDNGLPEEIDELLKISSDTGAPFTWFVDAGSHKSWLTRFAEMQNQEVGLHCYDHRIYLDAKKDEENIVRGIAAMTDAGVPPASFAAPFGFWSPDFGKAIDNAGFGYSSEFSWAYDALPHYPVTAIGRCATLQVPVHPIAVGGLRRSGYTPGQMVQYFHDVIAEKLARREPLFFYHHPGHRHWDVVRDICAQCLASSARPVSLGEYASWWKRSRLLRPRFRLEGESVSTSCEDPVGAAAGSDVSVCISRKGVGEVVVPLGQGDSGVLPRKEECYVPPADIRRTREFDLRGEIGRQFTRLQRKFP